MKIKIDLLPKGHRNRPGYAMKPKGLLFHTTNNWSDGAGDELHAEYMENTYRVVSWHETVDKDSCTQHIPHTENAWHAGDGGKGHYNRNWIGMEIACEAVSRGQKLDAATYKNAVERAAQICKQYNFGWSQLQPHKIVYGKNCPHNTLFSHDQFKKDVFARVAEMKNEKKVEAPKLQVGTEYIYVVKKGDTLTEIAEAYKTSVDYLARLNEIENPGVIFVGQRLKLKGTAPAPKPKAPVKKAPVKHNIPTESLRPGSKGQPVIDLQEVLTAHNPKFNPGKIDGHYGDKTKDAVLRYQKYYGVKPYDGIYGNKTEASLKKTYK
jgi:N-acetylmuramoyl-L-alanine amidase CwlA